MELLDYEKKHIDYLLDNSSECCLFLKKDNEFPLNKPCKVVLIGNGARNTIKGGTGSGDVASRFFLNAEQGLEKAGFEIVSKDWLDNYDNFKKKTNKQFIKEAKKLAHKNAIIPCVYTMGFFDYERYYDFTCEYNGDAAIYVLSRNSGEGNDRRNIKGDVKLSNKEVIDILYLNKKFKKFMLVLNVGGVVDLTPIKEVKNILLLSQLGVVTGDILANIILGKANPSGKLSTTWAKIEDYPYFNEFGNLHDTYYREGIYVGYRCFNTINKEVLYPFGYGLSYSQFEINKVKTSLKDTKLTIDVNVKNISKYDGKEVIQLYVSKPETIENQPSIELVSFIKTDVIEKETSKDIKLDIDLLNCYSFDSRRAINVLAKGKYIFNIGNSSDNITPVAVIDLENEVIIDKFENKCGKPQFDDLVLERVNNINIENVDTYSININNYKTNKVNYKQDTYIDSFINTLSNEELARICIGNYDSGFAAMVGNSCHHVVGAAGETTLTVKGIDKYLTMSDGPAGIRVKQSYYVDKKGKTHDLVADPMTVKMLDFLPFIVKPFMAPKKKAKGKIINQYTTAIPIGTALAQSFNLEFVSNCGNIIKEEMEHFNIDLWLAPALNIHRNILCGRNFEYYSEDPYLSGKMAAAMTLAIQNNSNKGTTIKHFACNNQELNRNNNNSHISERALREIYLKGFEIAIKESKPLALMTSYNLINGIHASESYELVNDILRCEWNYEGLVMSDWIASGRKFCYKSIYKAPYASNNIKAGNDLTMPGCNKDYKDIIKALESGKLTREELLYSASRIYRSINRQK